MTDEKNIKEEICEGEIEKEQDEAIAEDDNLMTLPMIPLRGLSVFPNMVLHFDIGREKSINAIEKAMVMDQKIFLAAQKDENVELPTPDDFYHTGTIGKVKQMLKLPGGSSRVLVEGICRATIENIVFEVPYFNCVVRKINEDDAAAASPQTEALMRSVIESFEEYLSANQKLTPEILPTIAGIEEPGRFADIIASHIDLKIEDKQVLLEAIDVDERLERLKEFLVREIEILNIEQDISSKVKSQMSKNQREYYLREQMRAIQEELGMTEEMEDEVEDWLKKLNELELEKKTHDKVEKEIKRFSKMQPASAEASVSRSYIETILDLPWHIEKEQNIDLAKAEAILNEDHHGLEKVKERVLEYLAVIHLSKSLKGPILCLVGPPGVGKTSIAKSVARSIDRDFVRMSLGGVRDEAEIRGHRRTYIGAIPGRIISAIKECGSNNPVFLFDEVDKIGSDFKGDPASALLEVLDPEQNKDFTDHYLEVPFDLSKVMFITTANTTDTIPRPLLDRMEVITVTGYTEEDKLHIAQNYLIPKKVREHGLKEENIHFSEKALRDLINYYTRESGVRNLEREIANICRKVARKMVSDEKEQFRITEKNLESYLGKKRFRYDIIGGEAEVGVTTGLAWTAVGGDTLFIETACVPGTGKLVLTGQLGDVMQESAKAGISYVRSVADKFNIDPNFYKEKDLHIHVPEGAVPKDGPSAGVTMCTAIISTLTGMPVKKDIAMTGEISLRGKVLPVGGIREKVMAAHRAGIKKVLLPADNERDIEEIPKNVRKQLEFVLLHTVDDALEQALVKEEK